MLVALVAARSMMFLQKCGKKPSKPSTIEKLVSDLITTSLRNYAVSWDKARSAYVAFMNNTHAHENFSCHPFGLQIYWTNHTWERLRMELALVTVTKIESL